MNSLPKTVTRQRCDCDLNLGPSAPESSTLTTRLTSHAYSGECKVIIWWSSLYLNFSDADAVPVHLF